MIRFFFKINKFKFIKERSIMIDFIENPNFPYSESQKKYLRLLAEDKDLIWIERKSCLCNGTKTSKILDRDRYGLKIPIMLCEDCGLIYCAKVLEKKSIIKYYNNYYAPIINYRSGRNVEERFIQYKFILPHAIASISSEKELTILDVGSSSGDFLITLEHYFSMIGISTNLNALEIDSKWHKSLSKKGINIIYSMRDKSKLYDIIILSHTLEHLVDPIEYLKQIHNVISPTGVLFVAVPGIFNLHNFYHYDFQFFSPHFHLQAFNSLSLSNLVSLAGFQPIEINENIMGIFCKSDSKTNAPKSLLSDNARRIRNYLKHIEVNKDIWSKQRNPQLQIMDINLRSLPLIALRKIKRKLGFM